MAPHKVPLGSSSYMGKYIQGTAVGFVGTTDNTVAAVVEELLLHQAETDRPQRSYLLEKSSKSSDFCLWRLMPVLLFPILDFHGPGLLKCHHTTSLLRALFVSCWPPFRHNLA